MCFSFALRTPAWRSSRRLLKPKLCTLRLFEPWLRSLRTVASMFGVVGDERAAVAERAEVLLDDEAGRGGVAELADPEPVAGGVDRLRVVFDHAQLVLVGDLPDRRHVGALAVEVDRDDGLGLRRDRRFDLRRVDAFVFGSQSTNTAVAPAIQMASAVAKNVLGWVMTSSPGPMPRAINASQIASVPLPTPMACDVPWKAASSCSNCLSIGPARTRRSRARA